MCVLEVDELCRVHYLFWLALPEYEACYLRLLCTFEFVDSLIELVELAVFINQDKPVKHLLVNFNLVVYCFKQFTSKEIHAPYCDFCWWTCKLVIPNPFNYELPIDFEADIQTVCEAIFGFHRRKHNFFDEGFRFFDMILLLSYVDTAEESLVNQSFICLFTWNSHPLGGWGQ